LKTFVISLASAMLLVALSGCVPNKIYRSSDLSVVTIPKTPDLPADSPQLPTGLHCASVANAAGTSPTRLQPYSKTTAKLGLVPGRPCLAFIEFDEFGEPGVKDDHGRSTQVDSALALISRAMEDDPQHQPVILTFIHGWKHNAGFEDTNVQGFEETLNYLYKDFYGPQPNNPAYQGHVVVGIYIAWRGDVVSKYWNVQRQISVYNRESAAMRVGGAAVSDTLMRISHLAHPPGSQRDSSQAMLIFVGHSFGALILERALTPAFIHLIDRERDGPEADVPATLADLVIYVNSAAAATEAKPMLDYLAAEGVTYRVPTSPGAPPTIDKPLFLAVSSSADAAVGNLLPIEHYGSAIFYDLAGSFRPVDPLSCFDPATGAHSVDRTHSQKDFWVKAAGHMDAVQSHELKEWIHTAPGPIDVCPALEAGAYATYSLKDPATNKPTRCYQIERRGFGERSVPPPCNGTPYWIIQTDKTLIPDHGTIFTGRLIGLIGRFLPQPGQNGVIDIGTLQTDRMRAAAAASSPKP
jgi:hypothetical protein